METNWIFRNFKITLDAINKFNKSVKPTSVEEIFEIDKEVKFFFGL